MNSINVLPTPQFVCAKCIEGAPVVNKITKIFFDDESDILGISLSFLSEFEKTDISDADLVLTTDISIAEKFTEIDVTWFNNKNAKEQGYILSGTKSGKIVIYAKTQTGLAYGVTTLLQLPALEGEFIIKDYPDFRYRGNKWLLWA